MTISVSYTFHDAPAVCFLTFSEQLEVGPKEWMSLSTCQHVNIQSPCISAISINPVTLVWLRAKCMELRLKCAFFFVALLPPEVFAMLSKSFNI